MSEFSTQYRIARNVAYRDIAGKIVLINPADNTLITLNPTASDVWRGLAKGQSVREVEATMRARYSADMESITKDIGGFLDTMTARRILETHAE